MRGRKHPLEVYQRASPFEGWEDERARSSSERPWWRMGLRRRPEAEEEAAWESSKPAPKPRNRRPRRSDPPGGWRINGVHWTRYVRDKSAGAVRRFRRLPLARVAWVVSPLVLAALVFYAVQFWPVGGTGGSQEPSLRNEWRVPNVGDQNQDADRAPRFYIQLKWSAIQPASDDPQFQALHDQDVQMWLEEKDRLDAALQKVLKEGGLGDLGLVVDAWHSNMVEQADVRLVIGGWEKKDDQVRSLHTWLKEHGFRDALIIEF